MPRSAPNIRFCRRQRPSRRKVRKWPPPGFPPHKSKHLSIDPFDSQIPNYLDIDFRPHLQFQNPQHIRKRQFSLLQRAELPIVARKGSPMIDEEEPPLQGDFLRSVCAALHRNGIRSIKGAPVDVPDPLDLTLPKKPPQIERCPQRRNSWKGDE